MSPDAKPTGPDATLEYLRKIPAFAGLELQEIREIFSACRLQQYGSEQSIYKVGSPSTDMFILLDGTLSIRTAHGVEVSQVKPVGLVGEMGVLTGEPRSADVVAMDNVMGLMLTREDLDGVCSRNSRICRKVLTNIIGILSRKIYDANERMETLKKSVPEVSKEVEELLTGNVFLI
jgi:CRP-like cAMP-binding protein